MPHIIPIFLADDDEIRAILKKHKTMLRTVVSESLGYKMEDVAVIPRPIAAEDTDLADNILRLEFVIDTGSRTVGMVDKYKGVLKEEIASFCELTHINFGVWIRPFEHSGFIEFKTTE